MAVCAISMLPFDSFAQVITWETGRKEIATWSYNEETSVLSISGSGTLDKTNPTEPTDFINEIINSAKEIIIGEGFTDIKIFTDGSKELNNLEKLTLPSTLWASTSSNNNANCFNNCPKLKEVVFTEGIEVICGFNNCDSIKSITIPSSVKKFDAFGECTSLRSVHITDIAALCRMNYNVSGFTHSPFCNVIQHGVLNDQINEYTAILSEPRDLYLNGKKITHLVIPDSVDEINAYVFAGCSAEKVTLPKQLKHIYAYAFRGMTNLKSIELPEGTRVGEGAFELCYSLKEITLNKDCRFDLGYYYGASYGDNGTYTFAVCDSIEKIILNEGVTELPSIFGRRYSHEYSPNGVKTLKLKSITIPSSLENVDILVHSDTCRYQNETAWWQTLPGIVGKNTQLYIGDTPIAWPSGDVVIPDGVTRIMGGKFYNYYNNERENAKVTSVKIPNSVTSISEYAFEGLTSVNEFDIPDNVTTIGINAFNNTGWYNNHKDGLLYLKDWLVAYKKGEPLKNIVIKDGTAHIVERLFSSDNDIEEITFPNSINKIGNELLFGCQSLKKVTFGDGIKEIGAGAFHGCTSLEKLELGKNVEVIGDYAFTYNNSLKDIIFNAKVKSIGNGAFQGCASIEKLELGENVEIIGERAFEGNESLQEITLNANLKSIGNRAFVYCNMVNKITAKKPIPASIGYETWGDNNDFYNTVYVYVPKGCIEIYNDSDWGRFHYIMEEGANIINGTIDESDITWSLNIDNKTLTLKGNGIIENSNMPWNKYDNDIENILVEGDIEFRAENLFENTIWYQNLPEGVVYLDKWILGYKGKAAENFTIKGDIRGVSDYTFNDNSYIKSFETIGGMKYIGKSAFALCDSLEYVKFEGVDAEIGNEAFRNCNILTGINLSGVKSIGEMAFYYCKSIEKVKIYSSTTEIGKKCFAGCSSLKEVEFEPGAERIPEEMFASCTLLTEIALPKSIKSIGSKAFSSEKIVTVYCNSTTPPAFEDDIIMGKNVKRENTVRAKVTVYVPIGCKALYEEQWTGFKEIIELEGLSVESVTCKELQDTVIYNLNGCRVNDITTPGIYIINGKKIMIK